LKHYSTDTLSTDTVRVAKSIPELAQNMLPELVQVRVTQCSLSVLCAILTWTSSGILPELVQVYYLNYFSSGSVPELVQARVAQSTLREHWVTLTWTSSGTLPELK